MKLTQKVLEEAKAKVNRYNCSVDMQLSPRIYVVFGTQGLTVTKTVPGGRRTESKYISQWRIKSAAEINRALDSQEWGNGGPV